jgi:exonuclease SbcC
LRTQESRFPQILLISHISEIQGEFANTLMVEMGTDNSNRVKEVK